MLLWLAVGLQVLVAVLMCAGAMLLGWSGSVQRSVFFGAFAYVMPSLLCLLGYHGTVYALRNVQHTVRARLGVLFIIFWELAKMLSSVALLLLAPRWVESLNWAAMVVAFIVMVKTFWLAVLVGQLRRPPVQTILKTSV